MNKELSKEDKICICPVCGTVLVEHPIYKVVRTCNSRIIGKHWFCPSDTCTFETDEESDLR